MNITTDANPVLQEIIHIQITEVGEGTFLLPMTMLETHSLGYTKCLVI